MTINEVLSDTSKREGLHNPLPFLRWGRDLDKDTTRVRLGIRAVSYHGTGCTSQHHNTVSEAVIVECPRDQSERCDSCILSAGETAVSIYEAIVVKVGDPPPPRPVRS